MEFLVSIVAIVMVFGPISYWMKRRYDLKEKQLMAGDSVDRKQLAAVEEERKLLTERIENLEEIVCNNDYELNLRIGQLIAGYSQTAEQIENLAASGPDAMPGDGADGNDSGVDVATDRTMTANSSAAELRRKAQVVRAASASSAAIAVGEVLAERYRIERLLGRGGMGAVYLANDEVLGEQVALKIISASWHHDRQAMTDRFRREVSAARKVSSPHVIRIHDLGEAPGGLLYISMEYIAGKTLAELIYQRGPLGKRDTPAIIGQICAGLGAAHAAGVIHRDLKPHNVLVSDGGKVTLIDFGLAKTSFMAGMTATGLMLGTPYYMSPEQVRGKEVNELSDIYSLGALTYHAVTGRPPFDGDNPIAISFCHLSDPPTPPRQLNGRISVELNDMILDALAKEPSDRPRTAAEFREAL